MMHGGVTRSVVTVRSFPLLSIALSYLSSDRQYGEGAGRLCELRLPNIRKGPIEEEQTDARKPQVVI